MVNAHVQMTCTERATLSWPTRRSPKGFVTRALARYRSASRSDWLIFNFAHELRSRAGRVGRASRRKIALGRARDWNSLAGSLDNFRCSGFDLNFQGHRPARADQWAPARQRIDRMGRSCAWAVTEPEKLFAHRAEQARQKRRLISGRRMRPAGAGQAHARSRARQTTKQNCQWKRASLIIGQFWSIQAQAADA